MPGKISNTGNTKWSHVLDEERGKDFVTKVFRSFLLKKPVNKVKGVQIICDVIHGRPY